MVSTPVTGSARTSRPCAGLRSIRCLHSVTIGAHLSVVPASDQGGSPSRARVLAGTVFHRRGRSPLAMVPSSVLTVRWISGSLVLSLYSADAPSRQWLSAWWRAIPAGFNKPRRNSLAAVCLLRSYPVLALARLSRSGPDGLSLFAIPLGLSNPRVAPLAIALNSSRAARLFAPPRARILGRFPSLTYKRNFA